MFDLNEQLGGRRKRQSKRQKDGGMFGEELLVPGALLGSTMYLQNRKKGLFSSLNRRFRKTRRTRRSKGTKRMRRTNRRRRRR